MGQATMAGDTIHGILLITVTDTMATDGTITTPTIGTTTVTITEIIIRMGVGQLLTAMDTDAIPTLIHKP